MNGLSLQWTVAPGPGRTLFFLFAYHGRDRDAQPSRWWNRFESTASRGHRIVHRDHYANPRSTAYQLAMVAAAVQQLTPDERPDAVVDAALGEEVLTAIAPGFGRIEIADLASPQSWQRTLPTEAREYRHVVFVFADALGLGCEGAEHRVLRDRQSVLVINGRRRVFALDRAMSRRLAISRWLAETRAVERVLALLFRPFASLLATADRLRGDAR